MQKSSEMEHLIKKTKQKKNCLNGTDLILISLGNLKFESYRTITKTAKNVVTKTWSAT